MARKQTEAERTIKKTKAEEYRVRRLYEPSSNPKSKQHPDGYDQGGGRADLRAARRKGHKHKGRQAEGVFGK